jgi:hypothetical protein
MRGPRYSKEEFARRGKEIYERRIRALVEPTHKGKVVAIDIETEEFEVAENAVVASRRLFQKLPDAQPWLMRVGRPTLHTFGSQRTSKVG